MALMSFLSCFLSCFVLWNCVSATDTNYPYQVGYFEQYVDHFNELSYKDHTFKQKYLYSDKFWKNGSGPIFFYTGNEGAIEAFWSASGFVHELASEMGAAVVFAEHRFYGASMPFGKDSLKAPYLGLLTIEQAMADYAVLITELFKANKCTSCKVIAFGGSYGGMLAAYMRFKYPELVHGALAASAPIYMQDPNGKRDFFFPKVTQDFKDESEFCVNLASRVFAITEMFAKEPSGLEALGRYFKLCEPMNDQADFQRFQGWLRNGFVMMSMLDYPYATGFIGNLPAFPIQAGCKALTTAHNAIYGLGDLVGVYYNSSQKLECYNISEEYIPCADPTGCGLGPDSIAWDFQACTEIWLPDSSNGVTDMFPAIPWNDHMRAQYCLKKYGVLPRHDWPSIQFWGEHIEYASNIIFSNGDLDPWRGGGVLEDVSETVVAINVVGGAHHLDLRGSNKADPPGVTEARQRERAIIRKWINN